jgi:hypothetical protein
MELCQSLSILEGNYTQALSSVMARYGLYRLIVNSYSLFRFVCLEFRIVASVGFSSSLFFFVRLDLQFVSVY